MLSANECGMVAKIYRTGSFTEKFADYVFAFARSWKLDVGKAATILRDLFFARTGETMNQMRLRLADQEEKLAPEQKSDRRTTTRSGSAR
jgi:hypothetical protein